MINKLNLVIDGYPFRQTMHYYNLRDSAHKFAEQGNEAALEAAAFYASTGDELSDFQNYSIADQAAEIMYNDQKELVLGYLPGPKINFTA
ncbi:DUF6470 family protein [Halanaerobium salsuginis]|jgi:hypothetical protein|uniref:Uncharacterized protein n=1 Tax=Halanaerobium salsuginis TaxID=29563 RepID=A0A1I4MDX2_9FIRM|nr:DUF6470 family protein [Halanaerobium salsuginis]SFM01441.1 hypothetical protein SAMN02983006_02580 [Halanaerobium salsuginis]